MRLFEGFLDNMNYDQTVLPDKSFLIGQKLVENAKIQKINWDNFEEFSNKLFLDVILYRWDIFEEFSDNIKFKSLQNIIRVVTND